MSQSRSFCCCALKLHWMLSGISNFLLPFHPLSKTIFPSRTLWATCLCQHTVNCTHSLTNDKVRDIKGVFPHLLGMWKGQTNKDGRVTGFGHPSQPMHAHTRYKSWCLCVKCVNSICLQATVQSFRLVTDSFDQTGDLGFGTHIYDIFHITKLINELFRVRVAF